MKPSDIYTKHFGNNLPVLIFIGRLTPIKRLDQLILALNLLHKRGSDYNLVFVGEGSEYTYLQRMIQEKDLSSRVWFYGSCYDETVNAELIYNADLCIAPGNVGLTAMHSMVYGTPVMTHNDKTWQMPEFEAISVGHTGDFFNRNDIEDMANKIELWFEKNKDTRERIRSNCFNEIDTSWTPAYQMNILKKQIK
ncbi:MAG: glycosyltransferase family 4 protein [Bacteroidaceae bacterium]|nr:glycosyltransferase family 4 protein [Bacteroidaceae bacterium]